MTSAQTARDETRAALDRTAGLSWKPWTLEDVPALHAYYADVEGADQPSERVGADDLRSYLTSPRNRPERDTLAGRDSGGQIVAVASCRCADRDGSLRRAWFRGSVHPSRRGEGIGRAVMAWQVAAARAWYAESHAPDQGPLRMSVYSDSKADSESRLAQRFGLTMHRYYAELTRHYRLDETVAVPTIDGITIKPWEDADPAQILDLRNETFADHWGFAHRPLDVWREQLQDSAFRPGWSRVAVDNTDGSLVAFLVSCAYEQDWEPQGYTAGYLDELGTRAAYRGRGIGTALLLEAMRVMQTDGMQAAEIGVDSENPSGAFGLYTSLGFAETSGTRHLLLDETLPGAG
ncbi:GNAT family N-acetyltransferase [Luteipulveratus mongoliensis]|uniref:GNAT family N-acetyltransferase n=1 Tax=Luteipulveratus mongoliensis TaxID=571913 RepID=UPI00069769B5|nr:GNAT family N-acetyltransferase [Luteipulveratus mongoliensis]